jgi:phosphate acetyltransferase
MIADDHPFLSRQTPQAPERLLKQARSAGTPRVALVNAGAPTPLEGLREACDAGLAEPILLGDPIRIHRAAEQIGWDIKPFRLIPAPHDTAAPKAAELAVAGEADAIMKGQIHTSTFLKGLLPSSRGLRAKDAVCGHVFHITAPGSDRPLLLTDAALNVRPDVATRQACLAHAVRLAGLVGIERPHCGVLAPSEDVTPTIACTGEAAGIAAWARGRSSARSSKGPSRST